MAVVSNTISVSVLNSATVLEQTAANLSAGTSVDLTTVYGMPANPYTNVDDIQWMTIAAFYDGTHKEFHYVGKGASGENSNRWNHYIFDLQTQTWYRPMSYAINGASASGHAWQVGFYNGNVYIQRNNQKNLVWFNRNTWVSGGKLNGTVDALPSWWNNTTSAPPDSDAWPSTANGISPHPNCFGTGDAGIVVAGRYYVYGWRISTGVWYRLSPLFYGVYPDIGGDGNGGGGFYCPTGDYAIVGTGQLSSALGGGPGPAWRVPAGTGTGDRTTAAYGASTPVLCAGVGGSGSGAGKMIQDPRNTEHLLILHNTTGAIYRSTNYGVTWSSALSASHPFTTLGANSGWTAGMCNFGSGANVIIGLGSKTGAFQARMWKPNF